jgi:prepilin-type N-terminal cleavage/methylation domain-containing protein
MRHHHRTRRGFTLVELMVAAALAVLIMTVLAGAFGAALESLSHLRSMGTLAERLRTTHNLLQDDLQSQHLDASGSGGAPLLSDLRYDRLSVGGGEMTPPRGGFFSLVQRGGVAGGSVFEGMDQDTIYSTHATSHVLGFTVRRIATQARPDQPLARPDQLFTVDLTPLTTNAAFGPALNQLLAASSCDAVVSTAANPTFVSEWAEVFWFLSAAPTSTVNGVPQYTLYRRVRALTPVEIDIPTTPDVGIQDVLSCRQVNVGPGLTVWRTNTPQSVRVPNYRLYFNPQTAPTPFPLGHPKHGDDIVLTNVTSFEVKAAWQQAPQWVVPQPNPLPPLVYAAPPAPRPVVFNPGPGNPINFPIVQVPPPNIPNADAAAFSDVRYDDLPIRNTLLPSPLLPENVSIVSGVPNPTVYTDQRVFDTWTDELTGWNTPGTPNCIPFRARMMGVQVRIRVYEPKNKMTRQATLVMKL